MQKPEKPLPTDCCGTGCVRCVYEIYQEQLTQYEKWKKQHEVEENPNLNPQK